MFSFIFTLVSALAISVTGAYFSIIGLATIFPGSKTSVIVMGIVLEIAKIVTILWLHRNWKTASVMLKLYFSFAVLVLMGITSLGIFGFLSRAHIEHQNSANQEVAQIENLDSRIEKEKAFIKQYESYLADINSKSDDSSDKSFDEIKRSQERLKEISDKLEKQVALETERVKDFEYKKSELDKELNLLEKSSGGLFSNKKKKIEELNAKQAEERKNIATKIAFHENNIKEFRKKHDAEYEKITNFIDSLRGKNELADENIESKVEDYNNKIKDSMISIQTMEIEKTKYGEKIRSIEAEIGPLKYVIGVISDITGKELDPDQAVRIVIIIIMLVFDPLAVLLLVAAQTTYFKYKSKIESSFLNMKDHILYKTAKASQQDPNALHKLNKGDINVRLEEYEVNVKKQEDTQNSNSSSKEE